MPGWVKIHRDIKDHWVFNNPKFFQWWALMLFNANHCDKKISLGYDFYTVKRGGCAKSIRSWAAEFGCSTKATQNFMEMLENDSMITREIIGKGKQRLTLINISNYDKYQGGKETQGDTQEHTQTTTQGKRKGNANDHTYKELNNNKELKEDNPPTPLNIPFTEKEFQAAWDQYKAYRKKAHKFTFVSIDSENRKLTELYNLAKGKPVAAIKIIHQSIDNGYKGLFELKENEKKIINPSDYIPTG